MKKKFYVFFVDTDTPWYLKGLKKDFKHCFVIENQKIDEFDLFIRIENLINVVEVESIFYSFKYVLASIVYPQYKMIEIDVDVDKEKHFNPLAIMSCVTMTKKLLGINKPMVVTPWQLYKHLKELQYGWRWDKRQCSGETYGRSESRVEKKGVRPEERTCSA